MESSVSGISDLLHEAAETHHVVYRIVDGEDPDWATWYSDWLVNHSEMPKLLGRELIRSELTYMLVKLDKEYVAGSPNQNWEDYYAAELLKDYGPASA
jgi:hypothetical protein